MANAWTSLIRLSSLWLMHVFDLPFHCSTWGQKHEMVICRGLTLIKHYGAIWKKKNGLFILLLLGLATFKRTNVISSMASFSYQLKTFCKIEAPIYGHAYVVNKFCSLPIAVAHTSVQSLRQKTIFFFKIEYWKKRRWGFTRRRSKKKN